MTSIMRQWVPVSKFLVLSAIIDDSCEFIATSSSMINSWSKFWTPIFDGSAAVHNQTMAKNILHDLPRNSSWDWSKIRLPDRRDFFNILRLSQDNATCFNGLPFLPIFPNPANLHF